MRISFRAGLFAGLVLFAFLFVVTAFLPRSVFAVAKTWDGGGADNNWNTCANWNNDTCPASGDVVTFDSTSTKDVTINTSVTVAGLTIAATYSGIITQGSGNTVTISGAFSQAAGTFTGGDSAMSVTSFTLSGGTFTSTSATMTDSGAFTHTAGGTFNHGSGTFAFTGGGAVTDVATTETFYNLTINKTNLTNFTVSTGDTVVVNNTLTLTNGYILTGTVNAKGAISEGGGWDGSNSSGTLLIDGTNAAAFTFTAGGGVPAATVTLNNANYTISGSGSGTLGFNVFNLQSGTFDSTGFATTVTGAMTQSGGTWTSGSGTMTFSSTFTQSGGIFNGDSSTISFAGAYTLSGGTFNSTSGTATISSAGFTHTAGGTFNHNNGTITFTGSGQTIDVATSETFYNLTLNKTNLATQTISSGDTLVVSNTLSLTDGKFGTGTIEAQGSVVGGTGWDGNAGTLLIDGTATATGVLQGGAGALASVVTLNNPNFTLSDSGSGTIAFTTFNLQSGAYDSTGFSTTVSTLSQSGGTWTSGSNTMTFATLSQSGGTFNGNSATISITTAFTLSGGTYNASTGTMTLASSSFTHTAGGTFNHNNGTVAFTVNGNSIDVATSETFYNVTVAKNTGANLTLSLGDTLIFLGTLTLTDGVVNSATLQPQGDVIMASTFDGGTSVMTFAGSAATQTWTVQSGASALFNGDVTINKTSGSVVLSTSALTLDASNQDLTVTSGTFDLAGQNLTVNGTGGTMSVGASGNLQLQGGESITANASNPTFAGGSTVTYNGTSGPYTMKNYGYKNLVINGGATSVFAEPATLTVGAALTITSGVYSLAGFNVTVTGTFSNDGTLRLQGAETTTLTQDTNSGTWEYVGNGDGVVDARTVKDFGATDYYNLKINDGNATKDTFALGGDALIAGTLQISSSSLSQGANTITAAAVTVDGGTFTGSSSAITDTGALTVSSGTFTSTSGTLAVAGNLTLSGGTFAHNGGTVSLNGTSQQISGAFTFNNFSKTVSSTSSLTLPAGATTTIGGTMTLTGSSSSARLQLRSSSSPTQATINPTGSRTVQYLDVKDNNNAASTITCNVGCFDSGNNTGWAITIPAATLSESGGSTAVTEGGATDTYTIVLATQPTADVVITPSVDSQVTVSPLSVTFTTVNWATPQTVTVTAVDDAVAEGGHTGTITHAATSADTDYNGLSVASVTANITDNDTAGFTVGAISGNTSEAGGTATFTVKLTSQPTANVTIGLSSSNTAEGTVSPSSLTFTSGNWNSDQVVTVTGVDDNVDDGDIAYAIITAAATSLDLSYSGLDPANVSVTNTDNDTAGVTVGAISGATTEAGGTATFTVVLASQPTADVTIGLSSSNTAEGTVSPSSLAFTSGNWSTPQTVTVTGVDDSLVDGTVSYNVITAAASSADPLYSAMNVADVAVNNTDNDVASVVVSAISSNTTELGGAASFTVRLGAQPTADVTIGLSSSNTAEGTVSPSSLTFTTLNWNQNQTVTVTGVNDAIDDGDIVYTIVTAATVSSNGSFNGINPDDVSVTNLDDDTAGFTVSMISGNTSEAGATATFTVRLNSQPTASVTLGLSSSNTAEGTVSPSSLTFTSGNWSSDQVVTVTGVDDVVVDGDIVFSIVTAAAVSADPLYNGVNPTNVVVTNSDNDVVGITVGSISGHTTESGTTATFTIVLNTQPTSDVSIALTSSNAAEGTVSPSSVVFTSLNWSSPQTVTVTGVNDAIVDGNITYTIVTAPATSIDGVYNGINPSDVTVVNDDDDVVGITVGAISGNTTEAGSTATFTVVLNTQPSADVNIPLSSSNTSEGTVAPATLTFTSSTWSVPQTVTIAGVDDYVDDGDVVYTVVLGAATSSDLSYNGINPTDVSVTNTDDDTASITVIESSGATLVTEGGATDTYSVVLASQPTGDVVIGVGPNEAVATNVSSLTFTSANWNTPQAVTVTAIDDHIIQGTHLGSVTHSATSADLLYQGMVVAGISVSISDNDTAGVTLSAVSGDTSESGSMATFSAVLTSQPSANVTFGLTSSNTNEVTISPASLTFTATNWSTPQVVTALGIDDSLDDGNIVVSIVTSAIVSDDTNFSGFDPADVSVTNVDNDTAGVTVAQSSGSTSVTEGASTDTISFVLTAQPTADVTVTLAPDAQTGVDVAVLTFTVDNWNTPQVVTVTAVDDAVAEGSHASVMSFSVSSLDLLFNGLSLTPVTMAVVDNDTAGISVSSISGTTTETATTALFTVVLTSQPSASVTIAVSSNDTTEETVDISSLTFTSETWNVPQAVTVTGVNDDVDDGDVSLMIVLAPAVSADSSYNAINPPDVGASNIDDDTAGVTVTESNGATVVTEGGAIDAYVVLLNTQPTANVSISIADGDELTISPESLTFTSSNWNVPQVVTVTAVDDAIVESTETHNLTHVITSGDSRYNGVSLADVIATVTDNDSATPSPSASPSASPSPSTSTSSGGGGGGGGSTTTSSGPNIAVTSPAANDVVGNESSISVVWTSTGSIPAVNVYLSWDNGVTWELRRYLVRNTGSTTITLSREGTAKLRVEGTDYLTTLVTTYSGAFTVISGETPESGSDSGSSSGSEAVFGGTDTVAEIVTRVANLPESIPVGSLIKLPDDHDVSTQFDSTIFYVGADGKRHTFPNERVYSTWYSGFDDVREISSSEMNSIPFGTNVTYRPGSTMVKFVSDPRVYAVGTDGALRWVISEDAAVALYGTNWDDRVQDIDDALYSNYRFDDVLDDTSSWDPAAAEASVTSPSDILGLPAEVLQNN